MSTTTDTKYVAGRGLGIMLLITGAGHFLSPAALDAIIPPGLPLEPRFWTYASGVAEITIGLLMFSPFGWKVANRPVRHLAVWAALALFIAVYPANIYMAIDWMDRDMPAPLYALARLPLQFGLFYWCWALHKDMAKQSKNSV